ncbi:MULTISPECIES: amidase [Ramlibacter]|uniref:Amidase n=1 Tax=Ramlibacter pinisoli TaxID=2682844 RepID=A0A6N8IX88_9BURK|nr:MULTISPECIES: amidase [Ramlibacter]MBA2961318.1 amidase [Ramlibacter sp. CGMCC 1.13660]MVQ31262.1 amidase [Ramlibacter pinisoli]
MNDLIATRDHLSPGGSAALAAELERAVSVAASATCSKAFLTLQKDAAKAASGRAGVRALPLAGLPVSVKDLFDVEGEVTAAGSTVLADAKPTSTDSLAVARLRAAGGTVIGRTNMSEFAFSGVGVNPHHGTPANPADPATPRIPGGSSSGAAVSVAAGAAFIGLGSDTGGSIRIPAALCGIVGFKNTARLTPLHGALPLSTTLDTVCAMTRSVRDAVLAHEILADRRVVLARKPLAQQRFAVARTQMLDGLEPAVAQAFDAALATLRDAGARVDEIALDAIHDLGTIQATGGFAAVESYAWHRQLLASRGIGYDPRVRIRIERGAGIKAWEYLDLVQARAAWIARVEAELQGYDAVLSPTVPMVAPPIAQVAPGAERDEAFFRVNAQLLRNTSVVNMLDGCAISIPCHAPGTLPVGLMLWHGALHDDGLLDTALAAEAKLAAARGE